MRFTFPLLVAALSTPSSAMAQAGFDPIILAPTSDWVLDYGNEYCGLVRRFGEGETETLLQIASFGGPYAYRVTIIGPLVPNSDGPNEEIGLRLGTMPQLAEIGALMGDSGGKKSAAFGLIFKNPDAAAHDFQELRDNSGYSITPDYEFEQAVVSWELDFGDREIVLQSGTMKPALDAMRACRVDLLRSWGIDSVVQDAIYRHARPREETVRQMQRTYPREMWRQRQSAYVPIRAMVDEAGVVRSCIIQVPSPDPSFDIAVCEGLQMGYEPALNAEGRPVPTVALTSVMFSTGD